ncbi:MAG: MotA/TolQ/ExbB proton channel family protein [Deltaproteobacteria bacterium]|nr:MotA/TolQ/ExbB proton channel family protein [Deltaproteobacteria bacterium]
MYPILIVFAVGAAIAIERYITLTMVRVKNQSAWNKVQPSLMSGDFSEARQMTSEDDSTISQLLGMGLARQGAVRRREEIEIAMEESMMEIIPQLEKRTPYVALASSIATLLGLLGTIAIPLLVTSTVLSAKTGEIIDGLEMASVKVLNVISTSAKRQAEA